MANTHSAKLCLNAFYVTSACRAFRSVWQALQWLSLQQLQSQCPWQFPRRSVLATQLLGSALRCDTGLNRRLAPH